VVIVKLRRGSVFDLRRGGEVLVFSLPFHNAEGWDLFFQRFFLLAQMITESAPPSEKKKGPFRPRLKARKMLPFLREVF